MVHWQNFISFHDLSPEARFLWASDSIIECLGYTREEVVGLPVYDFVVKEDIPFSRSTHKENVINDLVATQLVCRYRHKDGKTLVPAVAVFSACYEFIVNCSSVIDFESGAFKQTKAHSAAMVRMVNDKNEEYARVRRHQLAFAANTWDPNVLEPEPRICMILNRFSRNLGILYASPSCELILHVDPNKVVGKPFLVFIRSDDLASFVRQVDIAKSSDTITHMRFWFQSPNLPQEIPCEAMLFGSADGLVVVLRRCRPFVRRRLINHMDRYEAASGASSFESKSTLSSSPLNSTLSTSSSSTPLATATMNLTGCRIKELDENDDEIRPLMAIQSDEPEQVLGSIALPKRCHLRPHLVQDDNVGGADDYDYAYEISDRDMEHCNIGDEKDMEMT
ncbi:hypothetical protein BG011_007035 [Mortierella polycephala]|uniref:PAS domain-containing protein n=1 Tax=Mortierella polycephala TaxID=41804 RepID=A0A9P6PUJ7_9FUNG|nr:hypothetical protein BG011_007035 [Mortierella polycephala]